LTEQQKTTLSQALVSGRLEGLEPTRDDVDDLVDR